MISRIGRAAAAFQGCGLAPPPRAGDWRARFRQARQHARRQVGARLPHWRAATAFQSCGLAPLQRAGAGRVSVSASPAARTSLSRGKIAATARSVGFSGVWSCTAAARSGGRSYRWCTLVALVWVWAFGGGG